MYVTTPGDVVIDCRAGADAGRTLDRSDGDAKGRGIGVAILEFAKVAALGTNGESGAGAEFRASVKVGVGCCGDWCAGFGIEDNGCSTGGVSMAETGVECIGASAAAGRGGAFPTDANTEPPASFARMSTDENAPGRGIA
jgi:hypothetical protein